MSSKNNPYNASIYESAKKKYKHRTTDVDKKYFLKRYVDGSENITNMRNGRTVTTIVDMFVMMIEQMVFFDQIAKNKVYMERAIIMHGRASNYIIGADFINRHYGKDDTSDLFKNSKLERVPTLEDIYSDFTFYYTDLGDGTLQNRNLEFILGARDIIDIRRSLLLDDNIAYDIGVGGKDVDLNSILEMGIRRKGLNRRNHPLVSHPSILTSLKTTLLYTFYSLGKFLDNDEVAFMTKTMNADLSAGGLCVPSIMSDNLIGSDTRKNLEIRNESVPGTYGSYVSFINNILAIPLPINIFNHTRSQRDVYKLVTEIFRSVVMMIKLL